MKFPPYPTYENSGVEWLGEVPSDWRLYKLRRIFQIKKRIAGELGYDIFSITQNGFRVKDIESNEGQLSQDYSKYQFVYPGDFAMNPMDLITGGADLAKSTGVTSPDYRVFSLRKPSDYSDRFLLYLFRHLYRNELFFQYGQGSSQLGRWRLPRQAFNDFVFPVPDKSTQQAIAKFLDSETAKIDLLISKQERLIKLSHEKREALILQAVTKGLDLLTLMKDSGIEWVGSIPAHWDVKRLKHLASVRASNVDKLTVETQKQVRLCNYVDVYKNDRITSKIPFMPATATKEQVGKFELRLGDVLITKDSETPNDIGVPALVAEELPDVLCGYHLSLVRPRRERLSGSFLYRSLQSDFTRAYFCNEADGVTRFGLGKYSIDNTPIATPPFGEQAKIADYIDRETAKIDLLIEKAKQAIELMKEHRTALISAAVTGKIDVRGVVGRNKRT